MRCDGVVQDHSISVAVVARPNIETLPRASPAIECVLDSGLHHELDDSHIARMRYNMIRTSSVTSSSVVIQLV